VVSFWVSFLGFFDYMQYDLCVKHYKNRTSIDLGGEYSLLIIHYAIWLGFLFFVSLGKGLWKNWKWFCSAICD